MHSSHRPAVVVSLCGAIGLAGSDDRNGPDQPHVVAFIETVRAPQPVWAR